MTLLHERTRFLGDERRTTVFEWIGDPDVRWARSVDLGRSASGRVWQLADPDEHRRPAIMRLAVLMSSLVYDEIARAVRGVPRAEDLSVQVFPLWMKGDIHDPPFQSPHRDAGAGRHPLVTGVYYVEVAGAAGGRLILHGDQDDELLARRPVTDDLVVLDGHCLHSVEPLNEGTRISVVVNFFLGDDASDLHVPRNVRPSWSKPTAEPT